MKVKVLYLTKAGGMKTIPVSASTDLFEGDDGWHPLPDDCIYRNEDGENPMIVLPENAVHPIGSKKSGEFVKRLAEVTEVEKTASVANLNKSSKSKRTMGNVIKYIFLIAAAGLILYELAGGILF